MMERWRDDEVQIDDATLCNNNLIGSACSKFSDAALLCRSLSFFIQRPSDKCHRLHKACKDYARFNPIKTGD